MAIFVGVWSKHFDYSDIKTHFVLLSRYAEDVLHVAIVWMIIMGKQAVTVGDGTKGWLECTKTHDLS